MDLVTQTSLEALLLKATSSQNQNIDTAALDAFCTLLNKEKDGAFIGVKLISARLPNGSEKEMLQTLNLLDTCMSRCGPTFQAEVGKFRFLNEMIKLVSPKYLGSHTPPIVKQKILQLMYIWSVDYPKEVKIKEAYNMLRKQGVIKETPNLNRIQAQKAHSSVFHDEEKSKILQKLLQSKDPEDIQAANWLIKNMVKEDEKRAELKSRKFYELESVRNNVRLLNEMLDSYKPGISSCDELDLIKELHQSCERLRPNLMRLVTETQQNEDILGDILQTNDELSQVFNKFSSIIIKNIATPKLNGAGRNEEILSSLLDFGAVSESAEGAKSLNNPNIDDVLCDLFNNTSIQQADDILQPVLLLSTNKNDVSYNACSKSKGLEDLDVLSDHLFKENLQPAGQNSFHKSQEKIPMNLLVKESSVKAETVGLEQQSLNFNLNYLLSKEEPKSKSMDMDDFLVDISDESILEEKDLKVENDLKVDPKTDDIKLSDIFIKLEEIKPSSQPPLTLLNEKNGVKIALHFAADKPRDDVHVFVVTTTSMNKLALSDYLFQAVVPKGCKLKMQPASSTSLPAYNSFLPPSALTQIMLVSVPAGISELYFKFIVSYVMDDETVTEMGEVGRISI